MKPLSARLADYLEVDGWDLVQTHDKDLDWWADEIWEMRSRWSIVGTPLFVTFLVDPMWEGNRRKGQAIWAIGASRGFPKNRGEVEKLSLIHLKASKEEVEKFVEELNRLRSPSGDDHG